MKIKNKINIIIILLFFSSSFYCGCITNEENKVTEDESIGNLFSYTITGIDPSSGIMKNTETAMDEYLLKQAGWILQTGTSATMMNALLENISRNSPIVITIWSPHAVFGVTKLRKLRDSKMIYNNPNQTKSFLEQYAPEWKDIDVSADIIASIVLKNFSDVAPAANEFLHQFNISDSIQSDWIYLYTIEQQTPIDIAEQWISNNRKQVDTWMPDSSVSIGKSLLTLGQPPWPGVTVKNQIALILLEEIGYNVSIKNEDAGQIYNDLINNEIDIMLAGWLPATHGDYWEGNTKLLSIAGINVYQTWLGLAVPDYVDDRIVGIDDLTQ